MSKLAEEFVQHGDLNEALETWSDYGVDYGTHTPADFRLIDRLKALHLQTLQRVSREESRVVEPEGLDDKEGRAS